MALSAQTDRAAQPDRAAHPDRAAQPSGAAGSGRAAFGPVLRAAREARGLTLRELAQRTAIRRDYLQALEDGQPLDDGQFGGLPEATFARAYLRTYARELGLDPVPLLADFDRLIRPAPLKPPPPAPAAVPEDQQGAPTLGPVRIALIAVLLALLVAVAALLLRGPAPAGAPVTPAPEPPVAAPPVAAPPAPPPAPAQGTVRLSVKSLPDGAAVYLDNRNLGQAPVLSFPVDARARAELRVEAPGRVPLKQTINLSQSRNLRATLPASGSPSDLRQPSVLTDLNTGVSTRTPAPPPPAVPAAPPAGVSPGPVAANGIAVRFISRSWARVTGRDGQVLFEGTPPVGSVQAYPPGVSVRAGNAGAVRVRVGDGPETVLGETGQVVTRQF